MKKVGFRLLQQSLVVFLGSVISLQAFCLDRGGPRTWSCVGENIVSMPWSRLDSVKFELDLGWSRADWKIAVSGAAEGIDGEIKGQSSWWFAAGVLTDERPFVTRGFEYNDRERVGPEGSYLEVLHVKYNYTVDELTGEPRSSLSMGVFPPKELGVQQLIVKLLTNQEFPSQARGLIYLDVDGRRKKIGHADFTCELTRLEPEPQAD